jgi:mono/diheme cytochrome c family protein
VKGIASLAAICVLAFALRCVAADISKLPPPAAGSVDFEKDIRPIFEKSCLRCHGAERPKGRFRLDDNSAALKGGAHGVAIVPGDSAKSPLIHYVARLVPDMEMPPAGKGDALTTGQIATLRAWVDAGANWPASTNAAASQLFSWSARGISVSGNERLFRQHSGLHEGAGGGLERAELTQLFDADTRFKFEARAMPRDEDYRVRIAWERRDAGFVRAGLEQFRRYDDDTGGYYAPFATTSFALGRELALDTGRAWIEFGLARPDAPRLVAGYEYLYRDGSKAMLHRGDSTQGGVNKAIYPAFKDIAEHTHVARLDFEHDAAGMRFENFFRAEVTSLDTRKSTVGLGSTAAPVPDRFVSTRDRHDSFQATDAFRVEREVNDWLVGSAGYHFARVSAEASLAQVTTDAAGAATDGERWFANQLLLDRESHLLSVTTLAGPWRALTATASVQGELTRQRGFGDANRQFVIFGLPFADASPQRSDLDLRRGTEQLALRWTGLPHTVVFAEGRFEQEDSGIFEEQPAGNEPFTRRTSALGQQREWRAGAHASPWDGVTLAVSLKRRQDRTDYTQLVHVTLPGGHPYPGFLRMRDATTDSLEARATLRAAAWWRATFTYQITAADYVVATDAAPPVSPGGTIYSGNYDAHVWSLGQVFTPWRRGLLNASVSYTDTRLATAANGAGFVAPNRGGVLSAFAGATWAFNETTDLRGNYSWSRADYGQNNAAAGLPAGVEYERHGLLAGVERRLGRGATALLQYGFFQHREPSAGNALDYTAHGVFATLRFAWP